MNYVPIAFITGKTGKNVKALLNLAQNLFKQARERVTTSKLNRVIREALENRPPPVRENRQPKIYYGTQVAIEPPTIVLFTNGPTLFELSYQRYLLNVFRERLPFLEVPIKLYLRMREETEPDVLAGPKQAPDEVEETADPGR